VILVGTHVCHALCSIVCSASFIKLPVSLAFDHAVIQHSHTVTVLCASWDMLMLMWICINTISQPQQLSTYALTLFKYKTEINNQVVHVGQWLY